MLKFALVIIVLCRIYIHNLLFIYTLKSTLFLFYIFVHIVLHFSFVLVVDVYQVYGGPCKALEAKFRAIKNTLGDPLLFFAVVSQCNRTRFLLQQKTHDTNHKLTCVIKIKVYFILFRQKQIQLIRLKNIEDDVNHVFYFMQYD